MKGFKHDIQLSIIDSPGPSVIPFAFLVNFISKIYSYTKFYVESENRCWQVWKFHLHSKNWRFPGRVNWLRIVQIMLIENVICTSFDAHLSNSFKKW